VKGRGWKLDQVWAHEEEIEPPPKEGFRAFARGGDYFFLTHSGKLLHAPKPDSGKRKAKVMWDDAKRPIQAALMHDPGGEVFLFCGPKGKGGKPCYFRLSGTPDPQEYDPAKFPAVKLEGPLGQLVRYARILAADDPEPR
jgi:hypothetical protein